MKSIVKGVLFTSTVLSGLCWAAPVLGQDVPDGDPLVQPASPASTGDIVVTARRRAESIQKVPVSVTAFSGEGLREREIKLVSDLTAVSPGAVFISSGASTNPTLTIRGQTKGYGPGLPAVLTYLNEVPLPAYSSLILLIAAEKRSEEHTSELQSLMRISYAVFCLKK